MRVCRDFPFRADLRPRQHFLWMRIRVNYQESTLGLKKENTAAVTSVY